MSINSTTLKRGIAVSSAVLLVSALVACTSPTEETVDTSKLTIAFDSDPAALGYDPLEYGSGQRQFYEGFYDALAQLQPDGSVAPGLATEFSYNEDSTVLTLTLADGVEFTDGSTLSADLVKANFDRRSDPALAAYSSLAPGGASEVVSVDVVDDTHVSLTFTKPSPGFEANLASTTGMIIGQDAIDDASVLEEGPDGSGPYSLGEATVKGSAYVMEKKDSSFNGDDYVYPTIDYKVITDPQARTNAVISGQADAAYILTSTAALAKDQGVGVSQVGGTVMSLLVFDKSGVTAEAFAQPDVRVALGYAINRQELVDGIHAGDIPAENALPKDNPGFSEEISEEYAYDPEKAKELLAGAGYPDGFEFEMVAAPGTQTDLEALQTYFAEVGVTMNITVATSTEQSFGAVNTTPLGILPLNWGNPVGTMFGVILGFANPHGEVNPALFGATQAVAGAQDDASRAEALTALNTELVSSGWLIPVYELLTSWAYNDTVAPVTYPAGGDLPLLSSFTPAA